MLITALPYSLADGLYQGYRFDGYIRVQPPDGPGGRLVPIPPAAAGHDQRVGGPRGVEIVEWHEDIDKSGGVLRRPGLDAMMGRVREGETDGIAIARLDRLSRAGVADALKLVQEIHDCGGSIAAIDLGIDPTTAFGEFGMTLMLALARMNRRNYVEMWEVSKANAIDRGAKISPTPYGYLRQPNGQLAPHPDGRHVQRAFELAASRGLEAAVAYLAAIHGDRKWTPGAVRRVLANRAYLGESRYGTRVNPTAHPPLVTRAVWEAAQTTPSRRRRPEAFPLTGLARCGTCGSRMVGGRSGTNRTAGDRGSVRTYRCSATLTQYQGVRCGRGAHILAERLETHVLAKGRMLLDAFAADVGGPDDQDLVLAERAVVEAEAELDAFAGDLALRRALGGRYHEHLAARVEAVDAAQAAYRELAQRSQAREMIFGAEIDLVGVAELLRSIGVSIVVEPGRAALGDRVRIEPADRDGPAGVASLHQLEERGLK